MDKKYNIRVEFTDLNGLLVSAWLRNGDPKLWELLNEIAGKTKWAVEIVFTEEDYK